MKILGFFLEPHDFFILGAGVLFYMYPLIVALTAFYTAKKSPKRAIAAGIPLCALPLALLSFGSIVEWILAIIVSVFLVILVTAFYGFFAFLGSKTRKRAEKKEETVPISD